MADTLVNDLNNIKERWAAEQPWRELIQLACDSDRWDVAMVVFADIPEAYQVLQRESKISTAKEALQDYEATVQEIGKERAQVILRSIARLAHTVGSPDIWREVFKEHLTHEELDKSFPLIFEG